MTTAARVGLEIRLLGSVEARLRGKPVPLGGSKQRTLLAALALEANRVVPDDRLIDLLWPEEPPEGAIDALRVHVSKLRAKLEKDPRAPRYIKTVRGVGYALVRPGSGR